MAAVSIKDLARHVRDVTVPRHRLRRRFPHSTIASGVRFAGEVNRVRLADGVSIHGPSVLFVTDGGGLTGAYLQIGEHTYVGEFNNIRCAGAPVVIGAHCLISQFVTIVGSDHQTAPGSHIVDQPWRGEGIAIGDGVWLGAGATILPGARIGDGAVVAANSVVRGEVAPGAVVAGSPARVVSRR